MTENLIQLSRFLSVALRHRAAELGLEMDSNGFVEVEPLWALVVERFGDQYNLEDLQKVIAGEADGKQRFERVDGRKIRALYGHSRMVSAVTYPPATPPETLYHGTSQQALGAILKKGLQPLKQQYVHLSATAAIARKVGATHSKWPVLLKIRARQAAASGTVFYHPDETHWLVKAIPPEFIEVQE